jgi:hypothetical protein
MNTIGNNVKIQKQKEDMTHVAIRSVNMILQQLFGLVVCKSLSLNMKFWAG